MPHIFLFLEIFAQEGGIQSYIKDFLQAYLTLPDSEAAEVFLLRDAPYVTGQILAVDGGRSLFI